MLIQELISQRILLAACICRLTLRWIERAERKEGKGKKEKGRGGEGREVDQMHLY